jgi:hypothetical protein
MKLLIAQVILLCIGVIVVSLGLVGISHANVELADALAIWLFDEGSGKVCTDSSGNGHDGTFTGDVKWDKGKFGDAIALDGLSGHVVAGIVELPNNSFTATLWVNMPDVPADWVHVLENGSLDHGNWWGSFRLEPGAEEGRFYVALGDGVQCLDNGANGQLIGWKTGQWEHLAVTYDGSRCRIYLNGAEVDGFDANVDITAGAGTVIIGCLSSQSRYYSGLVDEVAIFDPALEADDINLIMSMGIIGAFPVSPAGRLATTWSHVKSQ